LLFVFCFFLPPSSSALLLLLFFRFFAMLVLLLAVLFVSELVGIDFVLLADSSVFSLFFAAVNVGGDFRFSLDDCACVTVALLFGKAGLGTPLLNPWPTVGGSGLEMGCWNGKCVETTLE
jgi:hypothetical protein